VPALTIQPGDFVEHVCLRDHDWAPGPGQTNRDRPPQRYVVMALLRLGIRIQAVSETGQPTGEVVLLGYEHVARTVHAAAS
jgi:hypothetical protein